MNPTNDVLEKRIAALEGGVMALVRALLILTRNTFIPDRTSIAINLSKKLSPLGEPLRYDL
jgi:hypothetical protein